MMDLLNPISIATPFLLELSQAPPREVISWRGLTHRVFVWAGVTNHHALWDGLTNQRLVWQ